MSENGTVPKPDGIFGNETLNALQDFQIENKINDPSQFGIVGTETMRYFDLSLGFTFLNFF